MEGRIARLIARYQGSTWLMEHAVALRDLTIGEFETVYARVGRDHGPRFLAMLVEAGHGERLDFMAYALTSVWQMHEHPEHAAEFPRGAWSYWFFQVGYVHNGVRTERPDGRTRLYRGAAPPFRRGMSWTPNRELAEWFAWRSREIVGDGRLYTANVPSASRLAFIGDQRQGEFEYVVDTYGLRITEVSVAATEIPRRVRDLAQSS